MNIVQLVQLGAALARQASQTAGAVQLGERAYAGGAGLLGVVLAATGKTSTAADDNVSAAIGQALDAVRQNLGHTAVTAEQLSKALLDGSLMVGGWALGLRQLEAFVGRLQTDPLKSVLEE